MEAKLSLLAGRRTQISILLTIIALLLSSHSILYAKLEIGYLGLIHSLPVTFFVALAFLTVASAILWVSKQDHGKLLLLQMLLLIIALWLIPVVTGGSPPFMNHAYSNLGLTNYIAGEGGFSSKQLWYLSWPSAHIMSSMMIIVGSISFEPLLNVVPLFRAVVFLLPLYILLRNILGKERINYCWAGLWLFNLASWGGRGFISPQKNQVYPTANTISSVASPSLWERDSPKLPLLSTVGVLAVAIVPTHLLTSLTVVLMLSAFSVVRRTRRLLPIIGLCLVLIVCWDITGGGHVTRRITSQPLWSSAMETPVPGAEVPTPEREVPIPGTEVPTPEREVPIPSVEAPMPEREVPSGIFTLNPRYIAKTEVTQHLRGSESHIAVVKVRVLHSAIFALIGIAGAIFVLLFRRKSDTVVILAMSLTPLILLPISGHYGEELLQRVYMFSLPFMAYFGAMLLDIRSKLPWLILCFLLIVAYPTQTISRYGNQALDYFPAGRIAGLKFFDSNTTHGYVTGASPLGYTSNMLQYEHLGYTKLQWQENKLYTEARKEMPYYIAISNRDRAWYEWFWGNPYYINDIEQLLDNAVNCSLIYSNPVLKLYESDE